MKKQLQLLLDQDIRSTVDPAFATHTHTTITPVLSSRYHYPTSSSQTFNNMHSQTIIITTLALAIAASAKPKATPCTITSTYTESECCPQYPAQTEWIISVSAKTRAPRLLLSTNLFSITVWTWKIANPSPSE